ncbi:MAG: hypothetical protein AVDCRST_MAG91-2978 [uncultured Sphingomonadaceae bacterium]|uniref:mRNA interferase RelE n=1 Tax=uncultured Sphingomonadaceae bacterium TaxID=169976 RepID=A0A6J4TTQ0_9SPHN|nr:MAG: hypothetical protein AVDCRST_MAG91-2978 [uncultured Sphingomonadaceae bacterium]
MTSFELGFRPRARKDWDKLDDRTRKRLKKKLAERLALPRVQADKLRQMRDCYKIKLASVGYRLVYQVQDEILLVLVIAVGRREDEEVYEKAWAELAQMDD